MSQSLVDMRELNHGQQKMPSDQNSETASISFPSLEKLIAATLPVISSEKLMKDLISVWIEVFRLQTCAIVWLNPDTFEGFVQRSERASDAASVTSSPSRHTAANLHELILDVAPDFPTGQWLLLQLEGDPLAAICVPASLDLKIIPTNWLMTSARLISTAMQWDWQQFQSRLEAMAEFAAGAGHEINNPLGTIAGRTGLLLRDEEDPERRRILELIGAQSYRIRDMIGDAMTFARPPQPVLQRLDLASIIERVFARFTEEFRSRSISFFGNREAGIELMADEAQLSVLLSEAIRNALAAVPDGGRIDIDAVSVEAEVYLRVADNGPGLSETELRHCFDPFYSGAESGRGLGFGLSKCWRIALLHQGRIALSRSPEEFTELHIWLPLATTSED